VDASNLNSQVRLGFDLYAKAPAHGDFLYPKTPMQRFILDLAATHSHNDNIRYYTISNSLPTTPAFPDASTFTMQSTQGRPSGTINSFATLKRTFTPLPL
jgi:hypothetical protein